MLLGMLRILWIVVSLMAFLSATIPVFCTFFFFFLFPDGAMWSPCTLFFNWPIVLCFGQNHSMGDDSYPGWNFCLFHLHCGYFIGGIGKSALALNRSVEAGTVLGHGVFSLTWNVGALGIASGCSLCWGILQLGAKGSLLVAFLWGREFLHISLVPNYIQSLVWMWLLISPQAFG